MGKVKEWLLTEQYCTVCGQVFLPYECHHEVDIGAPTCSRQCYNDYHQIMNAIADMQEEERKRSDEDSDTAAG